MNGLVKSRVRHGRVLYVTTNSELGHAASTQLPSQNVGPRALNESGKM